MSRSKVPLAVAIHRRKHNLSPNTISETSSLTTDGEKSVIHAAPHPAFTDIDELDLKGEAGLHDILKQSLSQEEGADGSSSMKSTDHSHVSKKSRISAASCETPVSVIDINAKQPFNGLDDLNVDGGVDGVNTIVRESLSKDVPHTCQRFAGDESKSVASGTTLISLDAEPAFMGLDDLDMDGKDLDNIIRESIPVSPHPPNSRPSQTSVAARSCAAAAECGKSVNSGVTVIDINSGDVFNGLDELHVDGGATGVNNIVRESLSDESSPPCSTAVMYNSSSSGNGNGSGSRSRSADRTSSSSSSQYADPSTGVVSPHFPRSDASHISPSKFSLKSLVPGCMKL
eukprot:CAMPEP_0185032316 /NCGR_PEP_ID=MMETSP1103-20130426/20288_1 /TAXON_ID=36769 /ORGANISM="Paraphysomonas bandaiensis, Strain Caron Lab Isolate" /LENGTH=342 /DNA_ID=CAMNT_0027568163 /DNA_START=122 /DNA_END=1150 /DNA_ORIENTATION=-